MPVLCAHMEPICLAYAMPVFICILCISLMSGKCWWTELYFTSNNEQL